MENTTYAARLRYLDAEDIDAAVVDYDGLKVVGRDGHRLGNVDGFIIDAEARRVNYVVVDSGGWFTSRRLLLPIGHATLGDDRKSLQVDVSRDALRRFPEFDEDAFRAFSDDELRAFERNTVIACCPDEPLETVSVRAGATMPDATIRSPSGGGARHMCPSELQRIAARVDRPSDAAESSAQAIGETSEDENSAADAESAVSGHDSRPAKL